MKTLYKNKFIYRLNDFESTEYGTVWHYGELPEAYTEEKTFEDLEKESGFHVEYSLFTGKPIYARINYYHTTNTNKKDFKSASITVEPYEINVNKVSFKDLTEHLALADYVEWCKDNNMIPIVER